MALMAAPPSIKEVCHTSMTSRKRRCVTWCSGKTESMLLHLLLLVRTQQSNTQTLAWSTPAASGEAISQICLDRSLKAAGYGDHVLQTSSLSLNSLSTREMHSETVLPAAMASASFP